MYTNKLGVLVISTTSPFQGIAVNLSVELEIRRLKKFPPARAGQALLLKGAER